MSSSHKEQLKAYEEQLAEMGRVMQHSVDHASYAQAAFLSGNFDQFVQEQYQAATQRMNQWYEQFRQQHGQQPGSPDEQHATPSTG